MRRAAFKMQEFHGRVGTGNKQHGEREETPGAGGSFGWAPSFGLASMRWFGLDARPPACCATACLHLPTKLRIFLLPSRNAPPPTHMPSPDSYCALTDAFVKWPQGQYVNKMILSSGFPPKNTWTARFGCKCKWRGSKPMIKEQ
jgi:hypothetical protein